MHEINALWIPILGILMPLVLVPMIIVLKHRGLQREWQHKERMKALELGLPAPSSSSGGGSVVAIGAGVPVASVIAAAATSLTYRPSSIGDEPGVIAIVWAFALLISILGMATSLILAHIQGRARKETDSLNAMRDGKPVFDPDAYDVVSSRG